MKIVHPIPRKGIFPLWTFLLPSPFPLAAASFHPHTLSHLSPQTALLIFTLLTVILHPLTHWPLFGPPHKVSLFRRRCLQRHSIALPFLLTPITCFSLIWWLTPSLKMEAIHSSQRLAATYNNTQQHNPEDHINICMAMRPSNLKYNVTLVTCIGKH